MHRRDGLRQRSALALVTVGQGVNRKYLMQWNNNWDRFNLVGGRVNNDRGDRDSFARALQRKLGEELGLKSPKDYRIKKELSPVIRQQFSRRQHIFKDYEFEDYRDQVERSGELKEVDPAYFHNLIYGALDYGKSLGFDPPKDFGISQYLLEERDTYAPVEFEFGDDGKPHHSGR